MESLIELKKKVDEAVLRQKGYDIDLTYTETMLKSKRNVLISLESAIEELETKKKVLEEEIKTTYQESLGELDDKKEELKQFEKSLEERKEKIVEFENVLDQKLHNLDAAKADLDSLLMAPPLQPERAATRRTSPLLLRRASRLLPSP